MPKRRKKAFAATILTEGINKKTQQRLSQNKQQAAELATSKEEINQNMEKLTTTSEQMEEREQGLRRAMEEHKLILRIDQKSIKIKFLR